MSAFTESSWRVSGPPRALMAGAGREVITDHAIKAWYVKREVPVNDHAFSSSYGRFSRLGIGS